MTTNAVIPGLFEHDEVFMGIQRRHVGGDRPEYVMLVQLYFSALLCSEYPETACAPRLEE